MTTLLRPDNPEQVREAIAWAAAESVPLELVGGGSKRALGRPVQTEYRLDLSALAGVSLYEPEELVMSVGPGTRLAEIETLLAERRQQLGFEPADLGPALGLPAGTGTIGGVFACNLSGPRRFKAGAARDHLLGFKAVSGRGEAFKSGGRVVKNVTGYDLCKLLTGSYGTLAALTELTFKVVPAPEKSRTILIFGLDDAKAVQFMSEAAASPHDATGIAHLPRVAARRSDLTMVSRAGANVTAIRLEGPAASVQARAQALSLHFARKAAVEDMRSLSSANLWREIRNLRFVSAAADRVLWRLSVPPAQAAEVTGRIAAAGIAGAEWFFDWAGGLIWLWFPGEPRGDDVRAAVAPCGGHAMLLRAPDAVRASVAVFQPQPPALAALAERVKDSFDPRRILNPGRMTAGL